MSVERSEFDVERSAPPRGAVFLSYASQDAEAARRIAEALRVAGVEVWFDQNELVGGDAWDAKIRKQIADCALFVPVISANTQARREGYFRLEWRIAAQRTHMIADGTPFLLPIVIDGTRDAEALVPAEFKGVQWTRLREGETPESFCGRVAKLLAGAPESAPTPGGFTPPAPTARKSSNATWIGLTAAGAAVVIVALWATRQPGDATRSEKPSPVTPPLPAVAASPGPLSRVLELRALNGLTRERLAAAEDLLAQILKADPTNAGALALAAQVDALMVYRSWDLTDERRQSATKRSARAVALAPDDFESRRAEALVAGFMVRTTASLQEAEVLYRALAAERAGDANVLEELGTVLHLQRKFDEAAQAFTQAGRPQLVGVSLHASGRSAEARRIADELLAQRRTAAALILKANIELFSFNNREAAQAAVNQLTPTELREDDAAGIALRLAVLSRDAEGLLRLLEPFPHPFVSILGVNYPRQYWTGLARSWQNQPEAAAIEWRGGLRSLEERLAAKPSDADALSWLAMFQSCLGQRAEMEKALRTYGNYRDLSAGLWDWNYCLPLLRFGERKDEVLARLSRSLRDTQNFNRILYAWARYSPEFDPIRGDPQFERLLRETRPPTALPYDDEAVAPAPRADEKSVAVLAFANLSDDKANEYFSDGISEELLNVLAKVPGLKVSARTSAFHFKGKNTPIPEIAKQLGVAYVVEGSVRRSGERVRITAQLIKAADGFRVWNDTFTRDLKDIFAVQDEIAALIAKSLSLQLGARSVRKFTAVNPQAFEHYVQARQAWSLRTPEGFARAEQLLDRALELSPDFVRARAALIDVVQMRSLRERRVGTFGTRHSPEIEQRLAQVRAVLAIDPELAEAYSTLGQTLDSQWLRDEAGQAYRRATELNPNYATGRHWYGMHLAERGRMDEALAELEAARDLDPFSFIILDNYGWLLNLAGRRTEALQMLDRAAALNPGFDQTTRVKAAALQGLGRTAEAEAIARRLKNNQRELDVWTLGSVGLHAEAKALLARLDPRDVSNRFQALLAAGEREAALDALSDPSGASKGDTIDLLFQPIFDSIRTDPRFVEYLSVLGLSEAHARAQAWRRAHPPEESGARP